MNEPIQLQRTMKVFKKRQPIDSLSSDTKSKLKPCTVNIVRCDKLIAQLVKNSSTSEAKRSGRPAKMTLPAGRQSSMSQPSSSTSRPSSTIGRPPSSTGTIGRTPSTVGGPPSAATSRPSTFQPVSRPLKLISLQSGFGSSANNRILTKERPGSAVTANRVIVKLKPGQNVQKVSMPSTTMMTAAASNERARRTPKPNPKYINDSMETKWANAANTPSDSEMSDTESDADEEEIDADDAPSVGRPSARVKTNPVKRHSSDGGPSLAELKAATMKMTRTPITKPPILSNKSSVLSKRKIAFDDENKKPPLKKEKVSVASRRFDPKRCKHIFFFLQIRRDSDISLIFTSDDDYNSFEDSEDSDFSEFEVRQDQPKLRQHKTVAAQRTAETQSKPTAKSAPAVAVKQRTPIVQRTLAAPSKPPVQTTAKANVTVQHKIVPKQTITSPQVAYRLQHAMKKSPVTIGPKQTAAPISPKPLQAVVGKGSPNTGKPIDLNDLEDFERMPTFTIVNINDIINKKDEVVVIEKGGKRTIKGGQTTVVGMDNVELTEETQMAGKNRRKTQHTVLSEKIDKSKNSTPTLMNRAPVAVADKSTKPYRNIIGVNNGKFKDSPNIETSPSRGPPQRILNSTLCKNSITDNLSPVVSTNLPARKPTEPRRFYSSNNNNNSSSATISPQQNTSTVLNRSKENKLLPGDKSLSPIAKNVVVQPHPTNRRVRKITCYETWFVIKCTDDDPELPIKTSIDFSLIRLGNNIKDVTLPSGQWSYKISLQKKKLMAEDNEKIAFETNEIYTGEVQDESIKIDQRHLYSPTNIMFRRRCVDQKSRMQFDRAVIFKNRTFFINIEGKNVRLIGAPHEIAYFGDIEVLLKIVDDISLGSSCVEQTNLCL